MLLTLGPSMCVKVSNGCPAVECMGVKAKAKNAVHERKFARADIVREQNGVWKIYVDGVLSGGAYNPAHTDDALPEAQLQTHECVQACDFYDHALPFDKLQ